jgi:hypothetical protein
MRQGQSLLTVGLTVRTVTRACNAYAITVTMLTQTLSNSAKRLCMTNIRMALMRLGTLV